MRYLDEDRPATRRSGSSSRRWRGTGRSCASGSRRWTPSGAPCSPRRSPSRATRYGIDDARSSALVSLVVDVQRGDHPRAALRHRRRATPSCSPGSTAGSEQERRDDRRTRSTRRQPREQTRARYPDEEGYVERDGVRIFYEVYGAGEPTVLLLPDLVDHPLAPLEGADPLSRAPLPGRHLRRPRERPLGPPGGPEAYTEHEFARDAIAVHGRDRHRARGAGRSRAAPQRGAAARRASTPSAVAGIVFIGPALPLAPTRRGRARRAVRRAARHRRGLGEVQPPLLARATTRTSSSSSSRSVHRAALDQADRGLRRLGARDRRRDARRYTSGGRELGDAESSRRC